MAIHLLPYESLKVATKFLKSNLINFFYAFVGLFIIAPSLLLYFIITLPFILCHSFLTFILSKFYRTGHGYRKMVSPGFTTAYALEYITSVWKGEPSRNTGLSRTLIEGHIPFEFWKNKIETGWINSKNDKNLRKFPELSEYVHSWLGYCYWRKDINFDLSSHVHYHKIKETDDLDQFTSDLFEKLMNTPFKQFRTPWDVYVIHGWRQVSANQSNNLAVNKEITVLVIRCHHVLGDGRSFASLLIKDLFNSLVEEGQTQTSSTFVSPNDSLSSKNKVLSLLKDSWKLMRDLGFIAYFVLWKAEENIRFHKCDNPGYVHQMSPLISMDSIKNIKNRFKVNFSSVLVSSFSAAITDCVNDETVSNFLMAAPRPLPGHPVDKMVNHLTGAAYNLPLSVNMHPLKRLKECDNVLKIVNKSLFSIYVFPVLLYMLSFHIAPIAKFGFKSRLFAASFSNNVGSDVPVYVAGKYRILEINAAVGTFDGSTGIVLLLTSYADQFRLHAVANSASLSKIELKLFMERVILEIKNLTTMTESSVQL